MVRFYIVIFSGYEVLYYLGVLVLWNDWKNVAFLFNIFLDVIIIVSVFSYYQQQTAGVVVVVEEEWIEQIQKDQLNKLKIWF